MMKILFKKSEYLVNWFKKKIKSKAGNARKIIFSYFKEGRESTLLFEQNRYGTRKIK